MAFSKSFWIRSPTPSTRSGQPRWADLARYVEPDSVANAVGMPPVKLFWAFSSLVSNSKCDCPGPLTQKYRRYSEVDRHVAPVAKLSQCLKIARCCLKYGWSRSIHFLRNSLGLERGPRKGASIGISLNAWPKNAYTFFISLSRMPWLTPPA